MKFDVPGLLSRIGELPGVINQGLLGPLPVNQQMGLDPQAIEQARQMALSDMATGMLAGSQMRSPMAGLHLARQGAQEGFKTRIVDMLKENEVQRMLEQRKAGDQYIQGLPEAIRPAAQIAGAPEVARAEISNALAQREPGWRVLTPQEEATIPGLDPTLMYKTNGQDIEVLGGRPPAPTIGSISVGGAAAGVPDYIKERQKAVATQATQYEEQAAKASSTVQMLDEQIKLARDAKISGSLAKGIIGLGNFARSIGLDIAPEDMTKARNFQAGNNQAILKWMANTGGARGYTEKESQILVDAFSKLEDSPQARVTILNTMRDAQKRDYEAARKGLQTKKSQLEAISRGELGITDMPDLPAPAPDIANYPQATNAAGEVMIFKDGTWQRP